MQKDLKGRSERSAAAAILESEKTLGTRLTLVLTVLARISKRGCQTLFIRSITTRTEICLVPRRLSFDENVRPKEGGKETTGLCTLSMVLCGSSPVTRFARVALACAMRETKRLRRRLDRDDVYRLNREQEQTQDLFFPTSICNPFLR